MSSNTNLKIRQFSSVQNRIFLSVAAMLGIGVLIFVAITLINLQRDARQRVALEHQSALLARSRKIETLLEDAQLDLQTVAAYTATLNFAREARSADEAQTRQVSSSQNLMLRQFLQLLEDHVGSFDTIQFVTFNGSVWTSTSNQNGILTSNSNLLVGQYADNAFFQDSLKSKITRFSPFIVTTNGLGQQEATLSIFAPVIDADAEGETLGAVQLTLSVNPILEIINIQTGEKTTDRWVLLNNQGRYLADSAAPRVQSSSLAQNTYSLVSDKEPELALALNSNADAEGIELAEQGSSVISGLTFSPGNGSDMPWQLLVIDSASLYSTGGAMLAVGVLSALGYIGALYFINNVLKNQLLPLKTARDMAMQLAEGQLPVTNNQSSMQSDEMSDITSSFQRMSGRIQELSGEMEARTQRHRNLLETATHISQETATLSEENDLLARIIDLICNDFNLYHGQVFILDDIGLNAVLVYSRGDIGRQLLDQETKVLVGSRSMVGSVTASGKSLLVEDTFNAESLPYSPHTLLADTRSELVLPLNVSGQVVGALDLHSNRPNAFTAEMTRILQILADQLAVAVHRSRQLAQAEQRNQQSDILNRNLTRTAWEETSQRISLSDSYQYDLVDVTPFANDHDGSIEAISAPITIRGEVIGTIAAAAPEGTPFSEGDHAILRAVADRVGLAIEGARLFSETQMQARRALALAEVGQLATRIGVEFERNLSEVFARVAEPANYDRWMLTLINEDQPNRLERVTWHTPEQDDSDATVFFDLSTAEHSIVDAVRQEQSLLVNDPTDHPAFLNQPDEVARQVGKHMVTPVYVSGRVVGALLVGRGLDRADLDERDEQLVKMLAAQVAVAIENRRLFRAVEVEREYLRSILETMPTGIVVLDPQNLRPVQANARAAELLNRQINHNIPFEVADYNLIRTGTNVPYPTEEMPIFVAASTNQDSFSDDLAVVYDDGTQTDLLLNAAPIRDGRGNTIAVVAAFQDISNLRGLENALQGNLREQIALYEATRALAEARNVDEAFDATIAQLLILDPMDGYIILLNEQTGDLTPIRGLNSIEQFSLPQELFLSDILLIPDVEETDVLEADIRDILLSKGIRATAAIPLRARDTVLGWISVLYDRVVEFSADTERFLTTLADNAAVAIDNRNLFVRTEEAFEEATTLYEISRGLANAATSEDVVQTVVSHINDPRFTQAYMAVPVSGSMLMVVSSWQAESAGGLDLMGVSLTQEQYPLWRLINSPQVLAIDDGLTADGLEEIERLGLQSTDLRSLVVMPLRAANRFIGVIWMGGPEPYEHTERDLRIYRSFVEQASITMEAKRLLEQTERRARQLATSAQVSQIASSILDLGELMPKLVDLIKESFGYDHVQIFLMDSEDKFAELRASTGEPGKQLLGIKHKLAKGSMSVIGQVTGTGVPSLALDTADATVIHRPNPFLPLTRSEIALPLIIQNRVVGALDVQSNTPNAFSDEDSSVLTTLAAQISVALDNARLFDQAQQRARDMSFLFGVTTTASTPDQSLKEALQKVSDLVQDSLQALTTSVYLADSYTDPQGEVFTLLRAVALSGSDQPISEIAEIFMGDEKNFLSGVARDGAVEIIPDIERDRRYVPIATSARSAVAAPLMAGKQVLGVIVLEDNRTNAYRTETIDLLGTLTNSLSAVIQSARLLEQVQTSNEQLRELDRLKSDFLANMSHELRTPLNSIIGFSRVILKGIDGPLTEMQEQDLSTIYNSGSHLLGLINDILDQAKINSGKMTLHSEFFDMKPVAEGVRSIGIGLIKDKAIDLRLEIASGLPKAYGDETRTRQVLLNLVSNASKFTEKGHVSIRVYPEKPEDSEHVMIRVDVDDTGIGIAEKDLPLLFEAFRQVDSSLTRTVGGTGLGLPIAKSLVEMQGGKMLVHSEIGYGSTFSILMPTVAPPSEGDQDPDEQGEASQAAPVASQPLHFDPPPKGRTQSIPIQKKRETLETTLLAPDSRMPPMMPTKRQILLIEDNPGMVDHIRRMLQNEGFDIFVASLPLEAEAMASGLRPTLIIMNCDFANGAGWDIFTRLQGRDDTSDIPVIINSLGDYAERAQQAGAFTFIQRPFMPDQMIDAVRRAESDSQTDRILIIDDQPESTRLLTKLLDDYGRYRVFAAHSGNEGISMVARRRPDLVILDLRMPEKDGFAVLEELQANPETANIPVMVVTADTLKEEEQNILSHLQIHYKTDLDEENYRTFIESVKSHLAGTNGN